MGPRHPPKRALPYLPSSAKRSHLESGSATCSADLHALPKQPMLTWSAPDPSASDETGPAVLHRPVRSGALRQHDSHTERIVNSGWCTLVGRGDGVPGKIAIWLVLRGDSSCHGRQPYALCSVFFSSGSNFFLRSPAPDGSNQVSAMVPGARLGWGIFASLENERASWGTWGPNIYAVPETHDPTFRGLLAGSSRKRPRERRGMVFRRLSTRLPWLRRCRVLR